MIAIALFNIISAVPKKLIHSLVMAVLGKTLYAVKNVCRVTFSS